MSADTPLFESTPHPFLKEPCLYIADPPGRVKWAHLQSLFSSCGLVRSGGKGAVEGTNRKRWKVHFMNTYYAEMALATLPGAKVPGVEPPWFVNLWPSPALTPAMPEKPLLPIFFYLKREWTMSRRVDAQTIFQWFRRAGPVLAVHMNIDIGYEQPACLVEFYLQEHQQAARAAGSTLHPEIINAVRLPFRVIDPWNLYCANLGPDVKNADLRSEFSKFGTILDARLMKAGIPEAWGFVSFSDRHSAANAMYSIRKSSPWGNSLKIVVRYHEPKAAGKSTPHHGAQTPSTTVWYTPHSGAGVNDGAESTTSDVDAAPETSNPAQDATQQSVKPPPLSAKQRDMDEVRADEARAKAEAIRIAQLKSEVARALEKKADEDRATAQAIEDSLAKDLLFAECLSQEREQACHLAQSTFDEATRLFDEALKRLNIARDGLSDAHRLSDEALQGKRKATEEFEAAQKRRVGLEDRVSRAQQAREAAEAEFRAATGEGEDSGGSEAVDDEQARREELEESIRKMAELRKQEELDRLKNEEKMREAELEESRRKLAQFEAEERERKRLQKEAEERAKEEARRAEEERKRREKEEAERKEREAREAEERVRQEARARQQTYQKASFQERERCKKRDSALRTSVFWNLSRSLERFRLVSSEFDDIKFCATQPLTFESIPWPILKSPFAASLLDVEWQAVELFFENVRTMVSEEEYRTMVEKAHRRFHPDKWRARGLMNTVLDEDLRQRLETAGNVVSQALGPIWTESRSR